MHAAFQPGSYSLSPIAETGERFSDFAPYVASINNDGIVAFQASLQEGGSGAYVTDGETITVIAESGGGLLGEVCSHPDINHDGSSCFYAELESGRRAVLLVRGGVTTSLAESAGPLGPTINEAGTVAFRADGSTVGHGVYRSSGGSVTTIRLRRAIQAVPRAPRDRRHRVGDIPRRPRDRRRRHVPGRRRASAHDRRDR